MFLFKKAYIEKKLSIRQGISRAKKIRVSTFRFLDADFLQILGKDLEIPDAFRGSGRVTHKGIIIGRKRMYVTLSRHESGQDKSRG